MPSVDSRTARYFLAESQEQRNLAVSRSTGSPSTVNGTPSTGVWRTIMWGSSPSATTTSKGLGAPGRTATSRSCNSVAKAVTAVIRLPCPASSVTCEELQVLDLLKYYCLFRGQSELSAALPEGLEVEAGLLKQVSPACRDLIGGEEGDRRGHCFSSA